MSPWPVFTQRWCLTPVWPGHQCLNVAAEETHCELRALLRILYPIPDATSCKLQLNTFILWKAHCAMRVAANIVLLKCHAALHEHQKMLELSWSVVVLIH